MGAWAILMSIPHVTYDLKVEKGRDRPVNALYRGDRFAGYAGGNPAANELSAARQEIGHSLTYGRKLRPRFPRKSCVQKTPLEFVQFSSGILAISG